MTRDIRAATFSDVPAIVAVVDGAYRPYIERIGRPPAPMTADYRGLVANTDHVHLLVDEEDVLGVLVTSACTDHLLLENVCVAPASRGSGAGRALIAYAEQRARALGLTQVRLYTNAAMTENLAYYPRLGYVEVRRANEDGFERVFFVKDLAGL